MFCTKIKIKNHTNALIDIMYMYIYSGMAIYYKI